MKIILDILRMLDMTAQILLFILTVLIILMIITLSDIMGLGEELKFMLTGSILIYHLMT